MRKLLYVPIIHSEADLGRLGPTIERRSAALYGERRWAEHKETMARFWESVAEYLLSLDVARLKIYQDGLAADGELGRRIIAEAARRSSENYQIILDLIKKGAEIRKTEDTSLLVQEYEDMARRTSETAAETISSHYRSRMHQDHLTEERDRFTAKTINETLTEGEVGILFMGAYHNVLAHLAGDIVVEQVKEIGKVRDYFRQLLSRRDEEKIRQLARYLTAPILESRS
ncbi:MAG: hypothetical protein M1136_11195 [Chloroflexi bacterium]|nr:hypothetical protein [Chloroflexota bacterium]MCL5076192.1 hypothetical protein [Chloroflexota bacterium]